MRSHARISFFFPATYTYPAREPCVRTFHVSMARHFDASSLFDWRNEERFHLSIGTLCVMRAVSAGDQVS